MSVAFQPTDTNRIPHSALAQGMWIYNSSSDAARFTADDHRNNKDQDSTSSSSIGNNSDASVGGADSDDDAAAEVQSLFKGSLCALEDALPIKRGISTFYAGKSKSYTSLADAVSAPSIQDIVKPEDAYNRKRKNMIAHSVLLDKNRNFTCKTGISKRFANSNRGLGLDNDGGDKRSSPARSLPPLPARPRRLPTDEFSDSPPRICCSPWRSLSLSDLQHASANGASSGSLGKKIVEAEDD